MISQQLETAIQRSFNNSRQDRTIRDYIEQHPEAQVLPFVGSLNPKVLFLGGAPAACKIGAVPSRTQNFIDYATSFFSREEADREYFKNYLPITANTTKDYEFFGEVATAMFAVPLELKRSSELTDEMLDSCWDRALSLANAFEAKLVVVHGVRVWRQLQKALKEGEASWPLPASHVDKDLSQLHEELSAENIPFSVTQDSRSFVVLPLPHLGGTAFPKEIRDKLFEAAKIARRMAAHQGNSSVQTSETGRRVIRVAKKNGDK